MPKRPSIDVVVPVRDGYEATAACLASLREHGGYHRLILVDDASADAGVRQLLSDAGRNCLVLRNEQRSGFAAAVNRGIAAARGAVAILTPDAIVTRAWLDKLWACIDASRDTATATPLTMQPVAAADEPDADVVAVAAELASVPVYPQVASPGPVMLVRREVLAKVGLLDPALDEREALREFGARVTAAGYRNVVCDDAYVAHLATERGIAGDDTLAPLRAMLRTQRNVLAHAEKPGVLHVVHPRGGGTEKHIRELIAATGGDHRHYFLRIHADRLRLTEAAEGEPAYELSRQDAPAHDSWLRSMCAWLRIGLVHVHSLVGSGDDVLQMIAATALPYCYSVHDMYLPCPTVYLIDASGEYCNATTDPVVCRRCLSSLGLDAEIERWRERYQTFLAGAARVYAPSLWAGDTLLRYYPKSAVMIAPPHEEVVAASVLRDPSSVFALPDDEHRSVGILGAIGPEKGARIIDALAARIRERALPLRLVVIGYTDTLSRFAADDGVLTVHGAYARDEIEALFDAYRISLLLFPTVWPETFSYTLSEGWMAARPALVPPRGALAERVRVTGAGWMIDDWPSIDTLLDQLLRLTAPERRVELEQKSALARAVLRDAVPTIATNPYGDLLDEARPPAEAAISRYEVYASACRALNVAPIAPRAQPRAVEPPRAVQRFMRLLRG